MAMSNPDLQYFVYSSFYDTGSGNQVGNQIVFRPRMQFYERNSFTLE